MIIVALGTALAPWFGAAGQEPSRTAPSTPTPPPPSQTGAQPESSPRRDAPQPERPEGAPERSPEEERASLKARLERRLAENKQLQERLARAIEMIDRGEPVERVRQEVPMGRERGGRDGRRPDGSRPEGGHPDGEARPDGPPPGPRGDRELLMRLIEETNPELAARIREAREKDPAEADRIMARVEPHMRELIAERDPEMRQARIALYRNGGEIMRELRKLSELRASESPEAPASEARVREMLGKSFDLQVDLHRREIEKLEKRLAELREKSQEESAGREAYVERKMGEIEERMARWRGSQNSK